MEITFSMEAVFLLRKAPSSIPFLGEIVKEGAFLERKNLSVIQN